MATDATKAIVFVPPAASSSNLFFERGYEEIENLVLPPIYIISDFLIKQTCDKPAWLRELSSRYHVQAQIVDLFEGARTKEYLYDYTELVWTLAGALNRRSSV